MDIVIKRAVKLLNHWLSNEQMNKWISPPGFRDFAIPHHQTFEAPIAFALLNGTFSY